MEGNKIAAGTLIVSASTRRAMYSIRAPHKSHRLTWGLWGGMKDSGESLKNCLLREIKEEMGFLPTIERIYPFDVYQSDDKKFMYYTYICVVEKEFSPWISSENCGYCWIDVGIWPKPMHYGAKKTLCTKQSLEKINTILDQHA